MKKVILFTVLWGSTLAAECRMVATVEQPWNGDVRLSPARLLTVRVFDQRGCGRHVTEYMRHLQTVETRKPHSAKPGDVVTLRSRERTPHGRLLVEVTR